MDFTITEQQRAFSELAEQFAREQIEPYAAQWDAEEIFPAETLRNAAKLGFAAMQARADVGGSELSRSDAFFIYQALANACVSTTAYISIHNMVAWMIDTFASDELRQKWVPELATMNAFASYCLTEPSAGSDAAALKTSAHRDGDDYIINGSKAFISGGGESDIYACMVRTGEASPKGISCILVEAGTKGLSFGKKEVKLGWHSQPTRMVFFEDCRVPASNLVGEAGQGFNIALEGLNGGRVGIAACSLGGSQRCLTLTRDYMQERKQFGQSLADMQALQFKYADLVTEYEAARLLTLRATHSLDSNHPDKVIHCAMAKRHATDAGFNIANQCMQLYGGYGYLRDYPIERLFRDLRVHQILEGSNEIMRLILSRGLFESHFQLD